MTEIPADHPAVEAALNAAWPYDLGAGKSRQAMAAALTAALPLLVEKIAYLPLYRLRDLGADDD